MTKWDKKKESHPVNSPENTNPGFESLRDLMVAYFYGKTSDVQKLKHRINRIYEDWPKDKKQQFTAYLVECGVLDAHVVSVIKKFGGVLWKLT